MRPTVTQQTINICITFVQRRLVQHCTNVIQIQMFCVYWVVCIEAFSRKIQNIKTRRYLFISVLETIDYRPIYCRISLIVTTHWAHDVGGILNQRHAVTLIQRRNNVVCPVGMHVSRGIHKRDTTSSNSCEIFPRKYALL